LWKKQCILLFERFSKTKISHLYNQGNLEYGALARHKEGILGHKVNKK